MERSEPGTGPRAGSETFCLTRKGGFDCKWSRCSGSARHRVTQTGDQHTGLRAESEGLGVAAWQLEGEISVGSEFELRAGRQILPVQSAGDFRCLQDLLHERSGGIAGLERLQAERTGDAGLKQGIKIETRLGWRERLGSVCLVRGIQEGAGQRANARNNEWCHAVLLSTAHAMTGRPGFRRREILAVYQEPLRNRSAEVMILDLLDRREI